MTKSNKKKKRHRPVTDTGARSAAKEKTKKKKSAKIIAELHQLNKEKEHILKNIHMSDTQKKVELQAIDEKEEQLGGITVYQFLSKNAESRHGNFNSSRWVLDMIKTHNIMATDGRALQLLDVGALDFNYKGSEKIVQCTYIDLNPQKPGILQADFLSFKEPELEIYDIVVLSLVINFAGDINTRGEMLRAAYRLCKTGGYVAVVLPLACLQNSRYMTQGHMEDIMASLGFDLIHSKNSRKLSFKFYQKSGRTPLKRKFPKKIIKKGKTLNNFSIVLS